MDTPEVPLHRLITGRAGFRWGLVGLLLLVWALRLPSLFPPSHHPDEALYGYWGLCIGQGHDPWLSREVVDKPPLPLYVLAGSQLLLGDTTIALRLPGLAAGLLLVPLTGALGRALYRERAVGFIAAVGVGLSPFAIVFSSTGFPDPAMVAFGAAACLAAVGGRPSWAGVLAALSFAAKQTGLVWLPLSLLLLIFLPDSSGKGWSLFRDYVACWALVVGLVFAWDGVRVLHGAGRFWQASVVGYGGLRLIWAQELLPRLQAWLGLMRYLFASSVVNALLVASLPALVMSAAVRSPRGREAVADVLLVSFVVAYGLLKWLVAFPVWDRYLLPLVPVLAVALARSVQWLANRIGLETAWPKLVVTGLLVAVLARPAVAASVGQYPIGRERAFYDGFDEVISFLTQRPAGSVVYHHWLGWHYRYGLWDAPVHLSYWPNPIWMARDVQAFGEKEPRFVAFPGWESSARLERYLHDVGYTLNPVLTVEDDDRAVKFILYQVAPLRD